MSECTKFQELISSAVDNEISDADKEALEAHLAECETCRRVYEAFSAISGAAADSLAEVPKNFKENTMSLVMSEASRPRGVKRFLNLYGRYTAIAAVLAILIIGGRSVTGNMFRMGSAAPVAAESASADMAKADAGGAPLLTNVNNSASADANSAPVPMPAEEEKSIAPAAAAGLEESLIANDSFDYVTSESPAFYDASKTARKAPTHESLGYSQSFCAICYVEGELPYQLAELEPVRSEKGEVHYEIGSELFVELTAENAFSEIYFEDDAAETALVIYTSEQ